MRCTAYPRARFWRAAAVFALAGLGTLAACGGGKPPPPADTAGTPRPQAEAPAAPAPSRRARRIAVTLAARLPAPAQLPGLAAIGPTVIATGGLDATDASVASIIHVAPGSPKHVGALPQAAHDAGAAT